MAFVGVREPLLKCGKLGMSGLACVWKYGQVVSAGIYVSIELCRLILFHSQVFLDLCVVVAAPDEPLGGIQRVVGVGHGLPLGRHAHQSLSFSCECHNRGGGPRSLCIL